MSEELERVYTINLGKVLLSQSQHRSVRALNMIREFARRHMRTQSVKIDEDLAQQIWARGVRRPPRKIRVRMYKTDTGDILVSKYETPVESLTTDTPNTPSVGDNTAAAAISTTETTATVSSLPEPTGEISDAKEIDADFDDIGLDVDDKRDDAHSADTASADTLSDSDNTTGNVGDSSFETVDDVSKTESEQSASDGKHDDQLDVSDDTTTITSTSDDSSNTSNKES